MTSRFVIDSDLLIWHLRGLPNVVAHMTQLARQGALFVSAISRAEVLLGMRPEEENATLRLLDGLSTVPVDAPIADCAAAMIRELKGDGVTLQLPDALIGATAIELGAELHTCNARHYPSYGIRLAQVRPEK